MPDSEQGSASAAFPGPSTTTTLAALTTILLATGSALFWRSKYAPSVNAVHFIPAGGSGGDPNSLGGKARQFMNDTKDAKTPRTKERRRRGKDPVKEIMKGGKKGNKLLLKLTKAAEDMHFVGEHPNLPSASTASESSEFPPLPKEGGTPTRPERSRGASITKSSSSRSASASSSHKGVVTRSSGRPLSFGPSTDELTKEHTSDLPLLSSEQESESSRSRATSEAPSSSRSASSASRESYPALDGEIISQCRIPTSLTSDHADRTPSTDTEIAQVSLSSPTISPHVPQPKSEPGTSSPSHPNAATSDTESSSPGSVATPTPPTRHTETNLREIELMKATSHDGRGAAQVSPRPPPSVEANVYRKPPRFSKHPNSPPLVPSSPGSSSPLVMSPALSSTYNPTSLNVLPSTSYDPSPSCSPPSSISSVSLASTSSVSNNENDTPPITFPTLSPRPPPNASPINPPLEQLSVPSPKPSPRSPFSSTENAHGNGSSSQGNTNEIGGSIGSPRNTRHNHTPRRTPTPSSQPGGTSTPPPSLSAQTQIASLRGALEAARLREDKMRLEMEKRSKDLEALRWEGVAWRQREAELQNQILHLTHHLQAYTALYASMSPHAQHPSLAAGHHLQIPNMNGKSPHYRVSSTPSPTPSPTRPHLASHVQVNGMLSPMPSPLAQSTPHPHMFAYPSIPSPATSVHSSSANYNVNQSPPPPPPPPPSSSLFSVLFPYAGGQPNAAAGPSSTVSGSSSVGSLSPDLAGSGSPPPLAAYNRGRQRSRFWQGGEIDDWIETGSQSQPIGESIAEEEVNTILADAILKRPESIRRTASDRNQGQKEEEERSTEFTFPSLSEFGLGVYSGNKAGTRNPDDVREDALSHVDDESRGEIRLASAGAGPMSAAADATAVGEESATQEEPTYVGEVIQTATHEDHPAG